MSQIQWHVRHDEWGRVEVHAGWERRGQYFHWTVFGGEDWVLDEDYMDASVSARKVVAHLRALGVETPEGLEEALVEHREQDLGNVIVRMSVEKEKRGRLDEPAEEDAMRKEVSS